MSETVETKNIGLRGIKVADTKISDVDGKNGVLIYRGFSISDLARYATYEEVAYLLFHDTLPGSDELKSFRERLSAERTLPEGFLDILRKIPVTTHPMDVLQASVSLLAGFDPRIRETTREANVAMAMRLTGRVPVAVAAWDRLRKGLEPIPPRADLGHASNFLYMLKGAVPDVETARDFDVCLVLHTDHSFNASTFAGREVSSTRAHMYASMGAAVGALSGELHGGANSGVMRMLLEIREVERAASWVAERLGKGGRIMGMGHAVYKTEDPRATVLREICSRLAARSGGQKWCELSGAIEKATKEEFRKLKGREIYPNVDFFSAPVYYMMGIEPDLFTPVFAVSRVAGWAAHIIEEKFAEAQPKPELYRPDSEYVGNYCGPEACEFIPLDRRLKKA
jgi:citrate synthase